MSNILKIQPLNHLFQEQLLTCSFHQAPLSNLFKSLQISNLNNKLLHPTFEEIPIILLIILIWITCLQCLTAWKRNKSFQWLKKFNWKIPSKLMTIIISSTRYQKHLKLHETNLQKEFRKKGQEELVRQETLVAVQALIILALENGSSLR